MQTPKSTGTETMPCTRQRRPLRRLPPLPRPRRLPQPHRLWKKSRGWWLENENFRLHRHCCQEEDVHYLHREGQCTTTTMTSTTTTITREIVHVGRTVGITTTTTTESTGETGKEIEIIGIETSGTETETDFRPCGEILRRECEIRLRKNRREADSGIKTRPEPETWRIV